MARGANQHPDRYVGEALDVLDRDIATIDEQGWVLRGFSIKAPPEGRTDWTVTIRADVDGQPSVAFTSGFTVCEALGRAATQFTKGQLKWRDDEYANR